MFCPTSNSVGCPLPAQSSNNLPSSYPAGQCVITGDAVANRTAVLTVFGDGVKLESGVRIPGNAAANASSPSPSSSPPASPGAASAPLASPANPDDPLNWVDPAPDGPAEVRGGVALGVEKCAYVGALRLGHHVWQLSGTVASVVYRPPK